MRQIEQTLVAAGVVRGEQPADQPDRAFEQLDLAVDVEAEVGDAPVHPVLELGVQAHDP